MKCVKKDSNIRRVLNSEAHRLVDNEGWSFCTKTEWRASDPAYESRRPKKKKGK